MRDAKASVRPIHGNFFVWELSLLGPDTGTLDRATLLIKIFISPRFPKEQPRAVLVGDLFHHRVSPMTKTICYFPKDSSDIGSHIQGIIDSLCDEDPTYDPRAVVNPEATRLLWGGEEKKKLYTKRLYDSVLNYGNEFQRNHVL